MPACPLENQGEGPVAPGGRQQHDLQVHPGVEHPVGQREPPPAQQGDGQYSAPEGAGEGEEDDHLPQQPPAFPEGGQHHQHRRRQTAGGAGQKGEPRQEDGHRVQPPQRGPQQEAQPGQGFPRQPGGGQEQKIVHHCVEQKQGIHIDDGHGYTPPFTAAAPSIIGAWANETGQNSWAQMDLPPAYLPQNRSKKALSPCTRAGNTVYWG